MSTQTFNNKTVRRFHGMTGFMARSITKGFNPLEHEQRKKLARNRKKLARMKKR